MLADDANQHGRRILVVDDVRANLVAMEAALAPLEREVVTATSGSDALRRLLHDDFCLVLLDLQMPGMDGYETAELIRGRPRTRHLPIIFVTAHGHDPETVMRGYRLNAVDFLFKPINREILLAKAGVFVALRDQAEALAQERARHARDEARREHEAEAMRRQVADEQAKQAELARLNEVLAENDRRKDAFLAILGHELRNPLAPIRTAVELARGGALSARLVDVIDRQSAVLARLVDDLLDISRINADRLELRRETVDLRAIVDEAMESCRPALDKAHHTLELGITDERLLVNVDRVRILQVLTNVLSNACRFTPAGGRIVVDCQRAETEAIVRVVDNGAGIRSELLATIFDMFVGERVRSDGYGGLGLGLALARQLVQLHGGTIRAASEGVGKGATFEVALQLAEGAADDASSDRAADTIGRKLRVLVIDDSEDARETLAEMLRAHGHEVLTAADGTSGLRAIQDLAPEIALVDLSLPDLDGIAIARRLRASDPVSRTALIAVTGFGQDIDRAQTSQAGFRAHLVKPVRTDAILAAIAAAIAAG